MYSMCHQCHLFNHTIIEAEKVAISAAEVVKELEQNLED